MQHDQSGPLTASRWTEITWPLEGKRQTWKPGHARGRGGSHADRSACNFPSVPCICTRCIASLFQDFRGIDKPVINAATAELHRRMRNPHVHRPLLFMVRGSRETGLSRPSCAQSAGFPIRQAWSLLHQIPHLTFCCLHGLFFFGFSFFPFLPENVHKYRCSAAFRATQIYICIDMSICQHGSPASRYHHISAASWQWEVFEWTVCNCNDLIISHEIKRRLLLGRKAITNLDSIFKKQRHYITNKGPSSQSYGFSSSHV